MLLLGLALAAPPKAVQVWVHAPTTADRQQLAEYGADFAEGTRGERVLVQLREQDLERLPAHFQAQAVPPSGRLAEHFHSLEEIDEELDRLAVEPGVERVQLGTSVEGRPIHALRMGQSGAPVWRILGAHHGDEASSSELALLLARTLIEDRPELLEDREVWLVPVVNPDGYVASSRNNANEVDLNRNYSHEWKDTVFSGEAPFSEPEVRAVRRLSAYAPPTLGLSLHSGAENIGYPWNYTKSDSPDEQGLLELAQVYGEACAQPGFYVTNGADWYVTYGDTNDWSLGVQGSWDFTLEVSSTKAPDETTLQLALEHHLPAALALLEQSPRARGRVVDASTGRPIAAELQLDRDSSAWVSDPETGRWARWLDTGIYTLTVSAPGYATQELELGVHASEVGELEVALEPSSLLDEPVQPSLVSRAQGLVQLELPGDPQILKLSRPGFDPLDVERSDQGFVLDPSELAAGAWSLSTEDWTRPRGLFVSDPSGGVTLASVSIDEHIELRGQGFAAGTRAWLLHGEDRALDPVEVLEQSPTRLLLDSSSLPADGTVDLLVLSNGDELAVTDLLGDLELDTSMPEDPLDTGDTAAPEAEAPAGLSGYRGCQAAPGAGGALALAAALTLAARRRKRCR